MMKAQVYTLLLAVASVVALQLGAQKENILESWAEADAAAVPRDQLKLHLMTDKGLKHDGAVCLDGSDAAFYFAPALDAKYAGSWQIAFQGGAWCFQEQDCADRAHTVLGSSSRLKDPYVGRSLEGFMSDNCTINPEFCKFNRVLVPYCDGTSFTGNVDQPVEAKDYDGKPLLLYFRGARILDALVDTLLTMGLKKADTVLLTGYSAGGLSTLLHADYIHERLQASVPKLKKFRAVPLSGFFLDYESTVENTNVYGKELANMVKIANSTGAMDSECVQDLGKDYWQCVLAPNAYKYVKAPTFIVNSGVDQWQISFILAGKLPGSFPRTPVAPFIGCCDGWLGCFKSKLQGFKDCSVSQIKHMNRFHQEFEDLLSKNAATVGNGAFVHSCPLHVEALDPEWNGIKVNGVSMQEAVYRWWRSDGKQPTKRHTTLDCHLNETAPYKCNPTCQ